MVSLGLNSGWNERQCEYAVSGLLHPNGKTALWQALWKCLSVQPHCSWFAGSGLDGSTDRQIACSSLFIHGGWNARPEFSQPWFWLDKMGKYFCLIAVGISMTQTPVYLRVLMYSHGWNGCDGFLGVLGWVRYFVWVRAGLGSLRLGKLIRLMSSPWVGAIPFPMWMKHGLPRRTRWATLNSRKRLRQRSTGWRILSCWSLRHRHSMYNFSVPSTFKA